MGLLAKTGPVGYTSPMTIRSAEFIKSLPRAEDLPKDGRPLVACVGRSNVGKSSIINVLTKQKNLSRVSSTPGRTQYINLFNINKTFTLVDLPGYGYAKVDKTARRGFGQLIHDFLLQAESLKLVIVIVDARVGLTALDREMLDLLAGLKLPTVIVANKVDALSKTQSQNVIEKISSEFHAIVIPHSSITGVGRGTLLETIDHALRGA